VEDYKGIGEDGENTRNVKRNLGAELLMENMEKEEKQENERHRMELCL
jgi:hypothetical protein